MEVIYQDEYFSVNLLEDIERDFKDTPISYEDNAVQSCASYLNSFFLDLLTDEIDDKSANILASIIGEFQPTIKEEDSNTIDEPIDVLASNLGGKNTNTEIIEYDPEKPGLNAETLNQLRTIKSRHTRIEKKSGENRGDVPYFSSRKRRRSAYILSNVSIFIKERSNYSKICEQSRMKRPSFWRDM